MPAVRPPLYSTKPPCMTLVVVHMTAEMKPAINPAIRPNFPVNGHKPVAKAMPFM